MIYIKKQVSQKGVGRSATEPVIRVGENGQVALNTLASAALDGFSIALLGVEASKDKKSNTMEIKGIKTPSKYPVKVGTEMFGESDFAKLNRGKEGKGTVAISLTAELKALGYDYKASGSQNFKATVDGNAVRFTLPVGSLTPREKQARKPRKAKASTATTSAAAGSDALEELEEV